MDTSYLLRRARAQDELGEYGEAEQLRKTARRVGRGNKKIETMINESKPIDLLTAIVDGVEKNIYFYWEPIQLPITGVKNIIIKKSTKLLVDYAPAKQLPLTPYYKKGALILYEDKDIKIEIERTKGFDYLTIKPKDESLGNILNFNIAEFDDYSPKKSLSFFSYEEGSGYIPQFATIMMRKGADELFDEKKRLVDIFKNWKPSKAPSFYSNLFHQLLNCYHISGSSLGTLYTLAASKQYSLSVKFLEKMANSKEADRKEFIKNKTKYMTSTEYLKEYDTWEKLIYLFRATDDGKYKPKIKDFSLTLHKAIDYCSEIYIKTTTNQSLDYRAANERLFEDIVAYSNTTIDYLSAMQNAIESGKTKKEKIHISLPTDYYFVPAMAIIEGYTILCELLNTVTKPELETSLFQPSFEYGELRRLYKIRMRGKSGITLKLFDDHLNWLMRKNYMEIFNTLSAIFELSLMTRLHPALLYLNGEPKLDEILIPFRFKKLLRFFQKNKVSLRDLCSGIEDHMNGLDNVCKELGWLKYSDSLYAMKKFLDYESWKEIFGFYLIRKIIEKKLDGDIFLYDMKHLPDIPVFIIYNGTYHIPFQNHYTDLPKKPEFLYMDTLRSIIHDVYARELFYSDEFKVTKSLVSKYINTTSSSEESILEMFKQDKLDIFIDLKELIT